MKKYFILTVVAFLFIGLTGCTTGRFAKTADEDDWIGTMDRENFKIHQNDMVDLDVKKSWSDTMIAVELQLQKAIQKGNKAEIEKWKGIKDLLGGTTGKTTTCKSKAVDRVMVGIKNKSSYAFEILDGTFKGTVMSPGETSPVTRSVSIGLYQFTARFVDSNGKPRAWKIARVVSLNTKWLIIKNTKRRT